MKARFLIPWVCAMAVASAGDFIRQIQTVNGSNVIYDMAISNDQGQVISKPLAAETAVFQLYATVTGTNNVQTLEKLDEKAVGTFLPTASVQILSADPYSPPRTRADQPYGVRLTINGLLASGSAATTSVRVGRNYKGYSPTTYAVDGTSGEYADSYTFRNNGTYTDNAVLQRLPSETPTKVSGEESFIVYLHPDINAPQAELAKGTVQVWPVATATISNIEAGKKYMEAPKLGSISVKDIYPKSVTYAQVYAGTQATGTIGKTLPSTVVSYNTYQPQNAQLALSELESLLDADGIYTLEVLTITPFNGGAPELLAAVSFQLKRTIEVNGSVTTIE